MANLLLISSEGADVSEERKRRIVRHHMRRVIVSVLALCFAAAMPRSASAGFFGPGESDGAAAYYDADFADPASAMRMRIEQVADHGSGRLARLALSPCTLSDVRWGQGVCWSSYGRNLHMVLPKLAYRGMAFLLPHTLYSYRSVDLRFPPALRLRLPSHAMTVMGYESYSDSFSLRFEIDF